MTMTPEVGAMRALVKSILNRSHYHNWSVQGFGMMRTYLDSDKMYRLNIWDAALAVPNVSVIHDHPWHFKSWVLSGRFRNIRYDMLGANDAAPTAEVFAGAWHNYDYRVIKTGEGGGPAGIREKCMLKPLAIETYYPGETYHQRAEEIHCSIYRKGTVTLNERRRVGTGEHARVFWPSGQEWVDAEPRAATELEVETTLTYALAGWNRDAGE